MKQVYVIRDLVTNGYFDSNIGEFRRIQYATKYNLPEEVKSRLAKLPEGYYQVVKILIKE